MLRTKLSFLCLFAITIFTLGVGASSSSADDFTYGVDDFLIYAGGNVTMRERMTVSGNIGAGGYLSIREDAAYSNGDLLVKGWVSVRQRTTISGVVLSGGNVDVFSDTDLAGDVQADGRVTIYSRAHLRSDLYATGTIQVDSNAVVDGSVNPSSTLPHTWTAPALTKPAFSPGSNDVSVSNSQSLALAPGNYRVLRLSSGSTIQLSAGSYHFSAVQIDQDVTFDVDDSAGPVDFYVNNNFSPRERATTTVSSGESSGFTLWVSGGVAMREDCKFTGNIRCFGNVSLRERTDFTGTIFASGYFSGREDSSFKSSTPPPVFYVRRQGSDANDGRSPSTAFRTIQRGVNSCTAAGSIVYVGPGVYQESIVIGTGVGVDVVSGTESKPIRLVGDTLGAYTNDSPGAVVLDGRSSDPNGFYFVSRLHWSIDGFEIANQQSYAIRATNSGLDILNCTIDVPAFYGVYMTALGDVQVSDCVFERDSDSLHSVWIQPINQTEPTSVTVTRNDMTLKGGAYHNSGFEAGWRWGSGVKYSYGIIVYGWNSPNGLQVEISNNQISDCYLPIYSGVYNSPNSSSLIANNTIVSSFYGLYSYMNNGGSSAIVNNIIDTTYYGLLAYGYRSDVPVVKNLLETGITYSMARYNRPFELDIITGSPVYVDAPAGDFSLAGGSPGVDAGNNQYSPAVDFLGASRPTDGDGDGVAVVDLGAYETVNAPTRVRVVRWREIGAEGNR